MGNSKTSIMRLRKFGYARQLVGQPAEIDVPEHLADRARIEVRDAAFSVAPMRKGFLLRTHDYAYMQYEEDASKGIELFDVKKDPDGYTNLAKDPEYTDLVKEFRERMDAKLAEVRANDLGV